MKSNKIFEMLKSEIFEGVLNYFNGDELAANVWIDKYALKNKEGDLMEKTPDDMHKRLAKEFARIEKKYKNPLNEDYIYYLFKDFRYLVPQGRPMAGIGNNYRSQSVSNCFLIPSVLDSYGSIMLADQRMAQIFKRGGGVGLNISNLRPSGSPTSNSAMGISGSTTYMDRFSYTTGEVAQNGRRGALILILSCSHPDVKLFITKKLDKKSVTNANISLLIDNEFMNAVKNDDFYDLHFDGKIYKTIKAKELWNLIIKTAANSAEPGLLFEDTIRQETPSECYSEDGFRFEGTNPCGEIVLSPFDSCRLLLMNLYSYVKNPFTSEAYFDYKLFNDHTYKAQRLMDDMVDLEIEKIDEIINKINNDPEDDFTKSVEIDLWKKIKLIGQKGRRTGLGITAEGDMIAALGLRYGTQEATNLALEVHKQMAIFSYMSSIDLSKERGCFLCWELEKEKDNPFIKRIYNSLTDEYREKYETFGRRNIANLTIAPAGSVSLLTQTTSGIEPLFKAAYSRRKRTDDKSKASFTDVNGIMFEEFIVVHPKLKTWYEINKLNLPEDLRFDDIKHINEKQWNNIFVFSPYYKATANDIDPLEKVKMQGLVQIHGVDHSISVTHNLPKGTTLDQVSNIYMKAWEYGCKGVTVYVDGSLDGILNSTNSKQTDIQSDRSAPKRPKDVKCDIYNIKQNKEQYVCAVGILENHPYEVFVFKGDKIDLDKGFISKVKSGVYALLDSNKNVIIPNLSKLMEPNIEDFTRQVSLGIRHSGSIKFTVDQLNKSSNSINCFAKVLARTLKKYILDGEKSGESCPDCGEKLIFTSGCKSCNNCGYSKCS